MVLLVSVFGVFVVVFVVGGVVVMVELFDGVDGV